MWISFTDPKWSNVCWPRTQHTICSCITSEHWWQCAVYYACSWSGNGKADPRYDKLNIWSSKEVSSRPWWIILLGLLFLFSQFSLVFFSSNLLVLHLIYYNTCKLLSNVQQSGCLLHFSVVLLLWVMKVKLNVHIKLAHLVVLSTIVNSILLICFLSSAWWRSCVLISLVPRLSMGGEKESLVSTVCACA